MPTAIIYCEKCGKLIPPSDVDRSKAVVFGDAGVCSQCISSMAPAELRQIRSRFPGSSAPAPGAGRGGAATARGPHPTQRSAAAGAGGTVRRRSSTGIVVVAFAVAALVGVAITLLYGSRPATSPGKGPDGKAAAGPRAGARAGAGDVPATGDAAARRRLNEIKSWIDPSHSRHAEARAALVEFAAGCDDPPCAAEAKALVTKIDADLGTRAGEELAKARESAEALASEGKLAEARKAIAGFRERFDGTEWFKSRGEKAVAEALGEIDAAREEAVKALVTRAREAFEAGEFDEARAALEGSPEWPDEFRAQADDLIKNMAAAEAEQAATAKLAAAWGAFPPGFMDAGKRGLEPAKAFLGEQRKALDALGAGG
ncbi:MAG: MCP four helix bundle domain-containing protein, partial [Planctomycetota bacterium]